MPTNFERVKTALDELVPRAARLVRGSVEELIGKRCGELRRAYRGRLLEEGREPVDYSRPTTQLAYLYRSLPAHANWVYQALETVPTTLSRLLGRGELKVACIGGGPGADMLGVAKYAEDHSRATVPLEFIILDREIGWRTPRNAVAKTLRRNVTQIHQHLDLTEAGHWTPNWDFSDADLFTFSFCLSEVWCYNASGVVTDFLRQLVRRAKRGALFLYVDNGGENFTELIEEEFGTLPRLERIGSRDNEQMRLSYSERRDVLEDAYMSRFQNERVKMGGNVSIRVWQKT